jgi:hypothetical protein
MGLAKGDRSARRRASHRHVLTFPPTRFDGTEDLLPMLEEVQLLM